MGFFDSIMAFIKGVTSMIDISGEIQNTISNSISDGIERAFIRIKKPFEQSMIKILFIGVSLFLIVWGLALFLDNFVPYHGLGFIVVGAFFGFIVLFFLKEKEAV